MIHIPGGEVAEVHGVKGNKGSMAKRDEKIVGRRAGESDDR